MKYNFTISSWYGEPKVIFNISHKVDLFIRKVIINEILIPNKCYDVNSENFIGITITTNSRTTIPMIGEPEYDKKNNFINYRFWLPYEKINKASNPLKEYVQNFFFLLGDLMIKYNLPIDEIKKIEIQVLDEILNKSEYNFEELDKRPDIDDILNELGL